MIHKFSFLENLLLRFDVIPHPVLDGISLVIAGRALQVSLKLGVFDVLEERGSLELEQAAKKLGVEKHVLDILVSNLEAIGYVEVVYSSNSSKIKLTKRGTKFFSKSSDKQLRNTIMFAGYIFDSLSDLEASIRKGKPEEVNLETFSKNQWEVFNNAMVEVAKINLYEVLSHVPFKKTYKKVLDLGGSHGLHVMEICKKAPNITAEVMDLEPVKSFAEKMIKQYKMGKKVIFRTGNVLDDELGQGYDIILAFNLIHGFDETKNEQLTKKVYKSLNIGGCFVILDQIVEAKGSSDLSKLVYSAQGLMLFNVAGGRTYSHRDIKSWMEHSGFVKTELKKLRMPGNAIVVGYK